MVIVFRHCLSRIITACSVFSAAASHISLQRIHVLLALFFSDTRMPFSLTLSVSLAWERCSMNRSICFLELDSARAVCLYTYFGCQRLGSWYSETLPTLAYGSDFLVAV